MNIITPNVELWKQGDTIEDIWKHFIALRSDGVSGKPHPNAKELGDKVKELLKEYL